MNKQTTNKKVQLSANFSIREGHDNFFTPLRLIFASLVVIGHAFPIALAQATGEPHVLYHYTFSYLAVNLFFIASGFLVTKSMVYRGDAPNFISARVLRIFPALAVHVIFVMIVIGPLATDLPLKEFFSHPNWYLQPLLVLSFFETNMYLPGIFSTNGEQLGSAPLWTLRFEVLAYIATLGIFSLGLLRKKWMVLLQFVLPSIGWICAQHLGLFERLPASIENLFRFGIAYGLGAVIYAYRDRLTFSWFGLVVLAVSSYYLRGTPVLEVIINVLLAWLIFRLAYAKAPKLEWMQRMPDLSYGIYIYHWAVMQMLFYWMPHLSIIELIALCFPVTIGLAALSWYIVEKPALRSKKAFAKWLGQIGVKSPTMQKEYLLD